MILSDWDIQKAIDSGRLVIDPFRPGAIQPVSVDLTLGNRLRVFRDDKHPIIDVKQEQPDLTALVTIDEVSAFYLHPGRFALGITRELVELPNDLMGRLDGKSSLGRLGLLVHSTAGFVDPGFRGRLVLEFSNVSSLPITLYAGMPIAQISFYMLSRPAQRPYGHSALGSKYQDQDEPTPSRYYLNFQRTPTPSSLLGVSKQRSYRHGGNNLRRWLENSQFRGNVRNFAKALSVPVKTAEDWVYGRNKPSPKNRARVFALTQLPEYDMKDGGDQSELLPIVDP